MAQLVTESIWHFAGYLHIADLLNDTPLHYSGAPTYKVATYTPKNTPHKHFDLPDEPLTGRGAVNFKVPVPSAITSHVNLERVPPHPLPEAPEKADVFVRPGHLAQEHALPAGGAAYLSFVSPDMGEIDLKITLTYHVGPSQFSEFTLHQTNVLSDLDVLLGNSQGDIPEHLLPKDPTPIIERMINSAEKLIPKSAIPKEHPDGSQTDVQSEGVNPFPIDLSGTRHAHTEDVEETSHYVNGERVDDPDQPIDASSAASAQIADIQTALNSFNEKFEDEGAEEEGAPASSPTNDDSANDVIGPGQTAEGEHVHVETDTTPTGGYAQDTTTGANAALNVAILDDRTDGIASLVIEGDLHETNAIIQINTLADKDYVRASGEDVARSIVKHANNLTNDATFVADPGEVFGDGITGFSGAFNWDVTFVDGDYWDIATLTQTNVLVDGDLSQQTTANTHFTAVLGANGELNFVELTQGSLNYDLIIVGGNYYDYNTILQLNLIYDPDVIKQLLGGEGSQTVEAGGNLLTNDASIVGIGSEDFKPVTDDVTTLVDAIANQQEILDPEQTLGIPGNGTGTLNVLYVSGDYYDFDLIYQTNVIADNDKVAQIAPDGAQANGASEASADLSQDATAGANEATNVALIIDVDSLSGYQYLGGEAYEDTVLVQANIVVGEDEEKATSGSDLHPDVVAAIAAMADDAQGDTNADTGGNHIPDAVSGDVLGGVMT